MFRRSSPIKRKSLAEERPDLLAQWSKSNLLSPSDVSCGSHIKVRWVCEKGHEWVAIVKNRVLLDSGCPYCSHRAVLKGYNDLQTEYPEIARFWSDKNPDKPYDYSPFSNKVVVWKCENGHEWKSRIADRTRGHGCPYCSGLKNLRLLQGLDRFIAEITYHHTEYPKLISNGAISNFCNSLL